MVGTERGDDGMISSSEGIKNENELEFAIFCIENLSTRLKKKPEDLFRVLTEQTDILYGYIIPSYDVLHTQGKEYILEDLIALMQKKGVIL